MIATRSYGGILWGYTSSKDKTTRSCNAQASHPCKNIHAFSSGTMFLSSLVNLTSVNLPFRIVPYSKAAGAVDGKSQQEWLIYCEQSHGERNGEQRVNRSLAMPCSAESPTRATPALLHPIKRCTQHVSGWRVCTLWSIQICEHE